MKVFISWSGQRSQALAEALRDWLPLVLHYVRPWLSKSDIQSGERWSLEIAKELQESNFGIICVTNDNLNSPWILFESGALAKSMDDGRVITLLLDLDFREISGPLAQFQAKKVEPAGIRDLVFDLNRSASSSEPEDRLAQIFEPLYASFSSKIDDIPTVGAQKQVRPQSEILEDLVSSIRNVETRIRDSLDEEPLNRRRARRRLSPGFVVEATRLASKSPTDPIQLLVFFGIFRDDIPWLYDLAKDLHDAIMSGSRTKIRSTRTRLLNAVETVKSGPLTELLGPEGRMIRMLLSDLRHIIPAIELSEDYNYIQANLSRHDKEATSDEDDEDALP